MLFLPGAPWASRRPQHFPCDCLLWRGRAGKRHKAEAIAAGPCPRAPSLPHFARAGCARAAARALSARPCLSGERGRAVPPSRVPSAQHAQPDPAQGRGRRNRRGRVGPPRSEPPFGASTPSLGEREIEGRGGVNPKKARGQNGGKCRFEPVTTPPPGGGNRPAPLDLCRPVPSPRVVSHRSTQNLAPSLARVRNSRSGRGRASRWPAARGPGDPAAPATRWAYANVARQACARAGERSHHAPPVPVGSALPI